MSSKRKNIVARVRKVGESISLPNSINDVLTVAIGKIVLHHISVYLCCRLKAVSRMMYTPKIAKRSPIPMMKRPSMTPSVASISPALSLIHI